MPDEEKVLNLLVRLWADQNGLKVTDVKITKKGKKDD